MSQKSNTVNFLIQNANGQPQMIKVVQNTTPKQNLGQIQLSSGAIKTIFKVPGTPDAGSQGGVYRTVNLKGGSKLMQVPVQAIAQLHNAKVDSGTTQSPSGQQKKVQTHTPTSVKVILSDPSIVQTQKQPMQIQENAIAVNSKNCSSSILDQTQRKRQDTENDPAPEYTSKRRKAADKVGKGLRHFSMKVCEKVRRKGFTSYNEVADELVAEFTAGLHGSTDINQQYDHKNIRRRVYDALNVLMAMNIISKEKKEIRWLGLPTNSAQECTALENDRQERFERIQQKTQQLHDLILQQISFKNLVERNKAAEAKGIKPSPSSAIHLPFIVLNTGEHAKINCHITNDKMEYLFNFSEKFQINDDMEICRRMGLLLGVDKGECTEENLQKCKSMVPRSLEHYVEQLGRGEDVKMNDIIKEELVEIAGDDYDLLETYNGDDGEEEEDGNSSGRDDLSGEEEEEEDQDSYSDVDVN